MPSSSELQGASSSQLLPHSLDAERAVLGAVLRDPDQLGHVVGHLASEYFFLGAHGKIFQAMFELDRHNEAADILTVSEKLKELNANSELLGTPYLIELTENCPVTQNIDYYVSIVKRYYFLRRIIKACRLTVEKAMNYEGRLESFVESLEREFLEITNQQDRKGLVHHKDVATATLKELEEKLQSDGDMSGVTSGFEDLDRITGGWQKSDLVIIAARPGMGKTAFALNCAINAVKKGASVAFFSLEMSQNQLMTRLISSEGHIDASRLRRVDLSEEEINRMSYGFDTIFNLPGHLAIDETPSITLSELRSRCRRHKKELGLDLVFVDYLQLMKFVENDNIDNRARVVGEISQGLKALAKELQVTVIALSQLNRGPENRTDKKPNISDLKDSGSIEQDADMILLLYREAYYDRESQENSRAELIVGKNRHGPTPIIQLAFLDHFGSFHNLAPTEN